LSSSPAKSEEIKAKLITPRIFSLCLGWFEVAECGRKLILGSAVGVIGSSDSAVSPMVGFIASLVFVFLILKFSPFKSDSDSELGMILSYSVSVFFLAAVAIKGSMAGVSMTLFDTILMVVLALGPIYLVGNMWWNTITMVWDKVSRIVKTLKAILLGEEKKIKDKNNKSEEGTNNDDKVVVIRSIVEKMEDLNQALTKKETYLRNERSDISDWDEDASRVTSVADEHRLLSLIGSDLLHSDTQMLSGAISELETMDPGAQQGPVQMDSKNLPPEVDARTLKREARKKRRDSMKQERAEKRASRAEMRRGAKGDAKDGTNEEAPESQEIELIDMKTRADDDSDSEIKAIVAQRREERLFLEDAEFEQKKAPGSFVPSSRASTSVSVESMRQPLGVSLDSVLAAEDQDAQDGDLGRPPPRSAKKKGSFMSPWAVGSSRFDANEEPSGKKGGKGTAMDMVEPS